MHPLLERLNLELPGLEAARDAYASDDVSGALRETVAYFRRREEPDPVALAKPNEDAVPRADEAVARRFTNIGIDDQLPTGDFDWTWRPVTDWEWTWSLNRFSFWPSLAAAYLATQNESYAAAIDEHIKTWVGGHPPTEEDRSCWRTIECGIRLQGSWLSVLGAMKQSESITQDAWLYYLRSVYDHAEFLIENPRQHNWLLMETNGLLACGLVFPEFKRADEWARIAIERFEREMVGQVHPDGAHIEYSTHYHLACIRNFTTALDRAERAGGQQFSQVYRDRIEKMWEHVMYMMRPDGQQPLLNDGDWLDFRPLLKAAGIRYARPDFIYAATNGAEGSPPDYTSMRFPWVRRVVMRSGWGVDDFYGFLETAKPGAGHINDDALTFEIMAYGTPFTGTMGRYTYENTPIRRYLRGSTAYNTVSIDGNGQYCLANAEPDRSNLIAHGPASLPWTSAPDLDVGYGRFEGPWRGELTGVAWERWMASHKPDETGKRPGFWVICDGFRGAGEHELRFLLHFYPGEVRWDETEGTVTTAFADAKANLLVTFAEAEGLTFDAARGQDDPPRGWYSPRYSEKEPAWEIAGVRTAQFPAQFHMVLVPFRGDRAPEVSAEIIPEGMCVAIDGTDWDVIF